MVLMLPKGVELDGDVCSGDYRFERVESYSENSYKLANPERFGKITTFKTLRCPLIIRSEYYSEVLGDTPISTRFIKVGVKYDFMLEKSTSVTIKKSKQK